MQPPVTMSSSLSTLNGRGCPEGWQPDGFRRPDCLLPVGNFRLAGGPVLAGWRLLTLIRRPRATAFGKPMTVTRRLPRLLRQVHLAEVRLVARITLKILEERIALDEI